MHALEQRFGITCIDGVVKYISTSDVLTDDPTDIKPFLSMKDAKAFLAEWFSRKEVYRDEQEYYSVIPLVNHTVKPLNQLPALPPPDFYEVLLQRTADEIIHELIDHNFAQLFTPVTKIDEPRQYVADVVEDPFTGKVIGRKLSFSFVGVIARAELDLLKEAASRNNQWQHLHFAPQGNGSTQWFIITLMAETK